MNLIENLKQEHKAWQQSRNYFMDFNMLNDVFHRVFEIVKQHEEQSKWVRCDERLPKNPMFYLVDEEGEYFHARYFKGHWETRSKLRIFPEFWYEGKIGNPRKNIPVVLS